MLAFLVKGYLEQQNIQEIPKRCRNVVEIHTCLIYHHMVYGQNEVRKEGGSPPLLPTLAAFLLSLALQGLVSPPVKERSRHQVLYTFIIVIRHMKKKRYTKVLKTTKTRSGTSWKKIDKRLDAYPPGLRQSKKGKKYFENRVNRSDLNGPI